MESKGLNPTFNNHILIQLHIILSAIILCLAACSERTAENPTTLQERLYAIADSVPGTVGIAYLSDYDTITVNNSIHFPMMSVFKMHQSLAVSGYLQSTGSSIDSVIHIKQSELDEETWSPMLKDHEKRDLKLSVRDLLKYALTVSDNNASNLLFKHIAGTAETDEYVRSIATDTTFRIIFSEAEMKQDHALAYKNYTSPLSAAALIKQIFDSTLPHTASLDSIRNDLTAVTTGQDRLGAILQQHPDLFFAHKTGSGYRNEAGELIAHNDVGYFRLPDGREYSLAVFIRDFCGSEEEASAIIARISGIVYNYIELQKSESVSGSAK